MSAKQKHEEFGKFIPTEDARKGRNLGLSQDGGRCSLVVKSFASDVLFDFHRHCDLEVRYTREGMTDCWVICGQGNRSTVPSCKLGCDCMDSHLYPCHIGDWHVTKNRRPLVSIWDARERSHGVLKSLKSSPVGAAPWPNSEWRVVDARRTTLSKFACKSYMLTAFNMLNLSIITKTRPRP